MGQKEKELIDEVLRGLGPDTRLFRLNAGTAWQGSSIRREGRFLILSDPRPFHGAPEGFPDLAGWTSVVLTPDMVGQTLAVFTGVEVKTAGVRMSREQGIFRRVLEGMGGRFKIIREVPAREPRPSA